VRSGAPDLAGILQEGRKGVCRRLGWGRRDGCEAGYPAANECRVKWRSVNEISEWLTAVRAIAL